MKPLGLITLSLLLAGVQWYPGCNSGSTPQPYGETLKQQARNNSEEESMGSETTGADARDMEQMATLAKIDRKDSERT